MVKLLFMMKINGVFLIFLTFFYSVAYSLSDTLDYNSNMFDTLTSSESKVSADSSLVVTDDASKKTRTIGLIVSFSLVGTTLGIVLFNLVLRAIDNIDGRGLMVDG